MKELLKLIERLRDALQCDIQILCTLDEEEILIDIVRGDYHLSRIFSFDEIKNVTDPKGNEILTDYYINWARVAFKARGIDID